MPGDDIAGAINDHRSWDCRPSISLHEHNVPQHHSIVHAEFRHKLFDRAGSLIVKRDSDDDQALVTLLLLKRDETWDFCLTRRTHQVAQNRGSLPCR